MLYDLATLRRAATLSDDWVIEVIEEPLADKICAELRWKLRPLCAQIVLNTNYVFSDMAKCRTIMHELLELSLLDMWILSYQAVDNIPQRETRESFDIRIREARDNYIERRLREMPFWSATDVPVHRKDLENQVCSSRSKAPRHPAKAPSKSSYTVDSLKRAIPS